MLKRILPIFEKYLGFIAGDDQKNEWPLGQVVVGRGVGRKMVAANESFGDTKGINGQTASTQTVIVGVSGGPDSMALLDMLARLQKEKRFASLQVVVAHVNHGLRRKASDLDEKLVIETTQKYGFAVETKKLPRRPKSHREVYGREERRKFFEHLKTKYGASWILTAHHQNDNAESIVLHFLRGSGPAGLAGIHQARNGYLRLLLDVTKKDLLSYCRRKKIPFRIDRTNAQDRFRRNLLRNKIFPLFAKINPSFQKTIQANTEIFRNISEWLENEAAMFLEQQKNTSSREEADLFHIKDFRKLNRAVQKTVIQNAFRNFTKQPYRLSSQKISEVMRLIERNIGRKKISVGKYGTFSLEKGIITLSR